MINIDELEFVRRRNYCKQIGRHALITRFDKWRSLTITIQSEFCFHLSLSVRQSNCMPCTSTLNNTKLVPASYSCQSRPATSTNPVRPRLYSAHQARSCSLFPQRIPTIKYNPCLEKYYNSALHAYVDSRGTACQRNGRGFRRIRHCIVLLYFRLLQNSQLAYTHYTIHVWRSTRIQQYTHTLLREERLARGGGFSGIRHCIVLWYFHLLQNSQLAECS